LRAVIPSSAKDPWIWFVGHSVSYTNGFQGARLQSLKNSEEKILFCPSCRDAPADPGAPSGRPSEARQDSYQGMASAVPIKAAKIASFSPRWKNSYCHIGIFEPALDTSVGSE